MPIVKKLCTTNDLLRRFFDQEEVPNKEQQTLIAEDQQVIEKFYSTPICLKDGRYEVCLPRKTSALPYVDSRPLVELHF